VSQPFQIRRLVDLLSARGVAVTPCAERETDKQYGQRLLRDGTVTSEQLLYALAEQFQLTYVDLTGFVIAPELFAALPATSAYRLGVAPYRLTENTFEIATSDPYDLTLRDKLEVLSGRPVRLVLATALGIQAALKQSQGTAEVLKDVSEDFRIVMIRETDEGKEEVVALDAANEAASPIVRLINTLLLDALNRRASDIHIETYQGGITVKYRIDGVLYPATEILDRRHHAALISRLKVMAELDIAEKRVPQDGRFRLRLGSRDVDFRISVIPSAFGEDVVVRLLDKSSVTKGLQGLRLESLGMSADVLKKFRRAIHEPYGMVLITGPTGSGKTTTLYAALSEMNAGEEKIITIEDPVEYQLDGVVQIPVNEKKGLTFVRGLRSILRHDPDKIMVGEIRDAETAQIAVQSALTGHLVFTTVHANNAFDVVGRFSHMGLDVYSFVSALNCVMAQRLVRQVCSGCKRCVSITAELLELSGLNLSAASGNWVEGAGCEHCNGTGYRGRVAITELLDLSPAIRQMILDRRPAADLQAAAIKDGMVTLRQSALAKAMAGETTLKEINRVTFVD
jgi:type IV pilus assembly protein PilB